MIESGKGVFLSYASQDAEVARVIADELRGAGVEVWFDQSELVGGDAWDAKIRGQIASCALFVPIISANTQARLEGYFRIEWKLAAQRTHAMAEAKPFLLPVVIDATRDAEAHVPGEFRAVQWTRLRPAMRDFGGQAHDAAGFAAFGARVGKLLETGVGPAAGRASDVDSNQDRATPGERPGLQATRTTFRRWLFPVIAGAVLLGALAVWQPWRTIAESHARSAPATPAQQLVAKARQIMEDGDELNQDIYFLAEDLLKRAVTLDPAEPAAWALQAQLSFSMVWHRLDHSDTRREAMRQQAERARALAPDLLDVQIASANARAMLRQDLPGIEEELRGLAGRAPKDWRVQRSLGIVYRGLDRRDDAIRAFRRAREQADGSPLTSADLANVLLRSHQPGEVVEAERVIAQALAKQSSGRLLTFDVYLRTQWRADLEGAKRALATWPDWLQHESRGAILAWRTLLWRGDYDQAIAIAQRIPRDYLHDTFFVGPRAVLTARAHEGAGHAEAARSDWQTVVTLTNRELASAPNDAVASYWKAWALARLGDRDGAQAICAQMQQRDQLVAKSITGAQYFGGPGAAALWAAVGRPEKALSELRAPPVKDFFVITRLMLELDPAFASLRGDPGFAVVLAAAPQLENVKAITSTAPDQKSVAVLAFANLSDDSANESFSDGIAGELLTILQKIPGLRVAARTSAWSFKGKNPTAQEVGEKLGIAHVVEGSVQKSGNRVKITARLSRAATNEELWSESFGPIELSDVFGTQSEIAQVIVRELRGRLTGEAAANARTEIQAQVQAASTGGTRNPEAYQRYLQGRFFAQQENAAGWNRAIALYREAIALDPAHAVAWAEMGCSLGLLARYGGDGRVAADAFREARAAAEKALAINPAVARAHVALGWVQRTADWNWAGAEKSFRRALELAPQDAEIIRDLAVLVFNIGRRDEALAWIDQAIALDPLNAAAQNYRALILWSAGRVAEAERAMQRALALASQAAEFSALLSWIQISLGQLDHAAASAERETVASYRLAARACVQFARGEKSRGEATLREFVAQYGDHLPTYVAICHGYAGDLEQGVVWMERAIAARDTAVCWMNSAGEFRALSRHPRWPELLRRVGLGTEAAR
jgi:TolB-like protein